MIMFCEDVFICLPLFTSEKNYYVPLLLNIFLFSIFVSYMKMNILNITLWEKKLISQDENLYDKSLSVQPLGQYCFDVNAQVDEA